MFDAHRYEFNADESYPVTVRGVAPEGMGHYSMERSLAPQFPEVVFDSEQGEFFAYCPNDDVANRLVDALNRMVAS